MAIADSNGQSQPFQMTIASFLEAASSASPTPGGGSVAALVAALGASMTAMMANLTQGPKFESQTSRMALLVDQMQQAIHQFEDLLTADANAFNQYMTALKLPKSTEDEKETRRAALQTATTLATEVPLALAEACLIALDASYQGANDANPHVLSDLGIAAMLLETAGQSGLLTADINIPSIHNPELREQLKIRRNGLGQRLVDRRTDTLDIVRRRMESE